MPDNEATMKHTAGKRAAVQRFARRLLSGWHPFFLIFLAVGMLYFKTLAFRFTYFDDVTLVREVLGSAGSPWHVFVHSWFSSFYRPVLLLSLSLDAFLGGAVPLVYHLSNVLSHVVSSCLLFSVLVRLRVRRSASLFFSVLFAVHPLLVQAVAWVPGRNDSLLAMNILASFLFLSRFASGGRTRDGGGHLLFLALALFTKETAVPAVVVFLLYFGLMEKRRPPLSLLCGWGAVYAAWAILRHIALPQPGIALPGGTAHVLGTGLTAFAGYAGKMLFPVRLSPFPVIAWPDLALGIAAAGIAAIVILRARGKRRTLALFGCVWLLLFLLPVFAASDVASFEHRSYLPLIGMVMILAQERWGSALRPLRLAVAGAVLVVLCGINYTYCDDFISKTIFWESAVRRSPSSTIAHCDLGLAYLDAGRYDKAHHHLNRARELDSENVDAWYLLGRLHRLSGEDAEALEDYHAALAIDPGYADARREMGEIYHALGRYPEAIDQYLTLAAMAGQGENAELHRVLGRLYLRVGDRERSLEQFRLVLRLLPQDSESAIQVMALQQGSGRRQP